MSRLVFPYGIRFKEDGRIEIFPAAELEVIGRRGGAMRAVFYIDSGATTSVVPASDAEVLAINIKQGEKVIVRGIFGEPVTGYRNFVTVSLGSLRRRAPIIFIEALAIPRILGREGIFPYFGIFFDEAKRRTGFFEARKNRRFIDSFFG